MLKLIFVLQLLYVSTSSLGMEVVYEWWTDNMEFAFPSQEFRNESIAFGTFIPQDFEINSLAPHKHRMFITLPWELKHFVTVAYINLNETSKMSPKIMPYPDWDAHLPDESGERRIGQVFRARVDRCDRLWLLEEVSDHDHLRIIVMDLNSDKIIRTYTFPAALHFKEFFHWIVVDDGQCENTFAYVNDYSLGGLWTYSWAEDDSWHNDGPGYYTITDMILVPNSDDAFSTLYYQLNSKEYFLFVSTKLLRDKHNASSLEHLSYNKSESIYLRTSAFDPATNVMYYYELSNNKNLRLLLCWDRRNECHMNGISELKLNVDDYTVFREYMAVDGQGNLWIVANRGPKTVLLKFSPLINICTGLDDTTQRLLDSVKY